VDASGRALAGQRTCRERGLNGGSSEACDLRGGV
jgi:hypothetical protein